MAPPPLPPGYDQHHIVYLEAVHCALPSFDFPHKLTPYHTTSSAEVKDRIKDATIVIATITPITNSDIDAAPNLQLIAVWATGMGWCDKDYCLEKGVTVINCPQSNLAAVGEHFLSLYFASRRKVPEIHRLVTETSEWKEKGSLTSRWPLGPPLSCRQETLGIVGYGHLGKRFEGLAKAVGFGEILIADRKGVTHATQGRVAFEEVMKVASTIVVCCPKNTDTLDLIGENELNMMRKEALVINMARGGIVNEAALANALKEGVISGAAADVMDGEPCGLGDSPLLPDVTRGEKPIPNLILSPHVAWYASQTIALLKKLLKDGCEAFVDGKLHEEHVKNNVAVHEGKIWK